MNKPLITIQCGNYSNYIGSHFWNLQESGFVYKDNSVGGGSFSSRAEELLEIDNDVLYREGITLDRELTYTPRVIVVDLKGSLGTLPESGELYDKISIPKEDTLSLHWSGAHQVFREEPFQKNEFLSDLEKGTDNALSEKEVEEVSSENEKSEDGSEEKLYNLEESVSCWSDYLGARYHPRSVLLCQSYQHENPTHPFDAWGLGREVWADSSGLGETMEDRIRHYAEECDNLGGFQVVSDCDDGWGGVSSRLVELLSDEYHGKSLLTFPTAAAQHSSWSAAQCGARLAASLLSLSHLLASSSALVTPLSLARDWYPVAGQVTSLCHVTTGQSHYATSSLLALALDTATATFRRRHGAGLQVSPGQVSSGLACHGRRVASLSADVPLQITENVLEYFEQSPLSKVTPLLPGQSSSPARPGQTYTYPALVTCRGLKMSTLYSRRSPRFKPCPNPASYLETCIHNSSPACRPVCSFFTKPVSTGKPFPHIFNKTVSSLGEISEEERRENVGVTFTTALTSWETGPAAQASLQCLTSRAGRVNLGKLHRLAESGVETDEWREALENLTHHSELYSDGSDY